MASVASLAEPSKMFVIRLMTGRARFFQRGITLHGVFVAAQTLQALMRPQQGEFRLFVMVEPPQGPPVGVVAKGATRSESHLMIVIRFMAGDAGRIGVLEPLREMAVLASGHGMDSDQRKAGQIMVEPDKISPGSRFMAALACLAFLALVHIIGFVTAITFHG